ncbi:MAG: RNA-guided pseudouridylation complex pseudouridine synthase subunit Cbf5 [Candidatus Aenigmatarchaeota archaeon]
MWLIRSEEETNVNYGKPPEERTVKELIKTSILVIDKHFGPTSHQITAWVKEIFNVKKAGHAGTLDPAATGVLPIAIENATKAIPLLMGLDKEYVGVMHLHKEVDENLLKRTVLKFIGEIVQVPPVKSAVSRRPRKRKVYYFDLIEIDGKDVLFKIGCEAGTYVRKICSDLGMTLGFGAHLKELRRTRVGNFTEENAVPLIHVYDAIKDLNEEIIRKILIPIEFAIPHVKKVFVKDSAIHSIVSGSPLFVSGITRIQDGIKPEEKVAIYSLKNELVAIGVAKMSSKEMFEKKEGTAVRTDRVFLEKGIYPKIS